MNVHFRTENLILVHQTDKIQWLMPIVFDVCIWQTSEICAPLIFDWHTMGWSPPSALVTLSKSNLLAGIQRCLLGLLVTSYSVQAICQASMESWSHGGAWSKLCQAIEMFLQTWLFLQQGILTLLFSTVLTASCSASLFFIMVLCLVISAYRLISMRPLAYLDGKQMWVPKRVSQSGHGRLSVEGTCPDLSGTVTVGLSRKLWGHMRSQPSPEGCQSDPYICQKSKGCPQLCHCAVKN